MITPSISSPRVDPFALIEGFPYLPSPWGHWLKAGGRAATSHHPQGFALTLEWGAGSQWKARRLTLCRGEEPPLFDECWNFEYLHSLLLLDGKLREALGAVPTPGKNTPLERLPTTISHQMEASEPPNFSAQPNT